MTRRWVRFVEGFRRSAGEMREPETWRRRRFGRCGIEMSRGKLVSSRRASGGLGGKGEEEEGGRGGRTFVFGPEPAAADAEFDEVRAALKDVGETAFGEEGGAPERESFEGLRVAEEVKQVRVGDAVSGS